jgi:hypothetical protein
MTRRTIAWSSATALLATMLLFAATSVEAATSLPRDLLPSVAARGACSGPSHWRLVVRPDLGTLRVRFVVRGGARGHTWHVFLDHDGAGFFAGSRRSGEGGFFQVRRRTPNMPGSDRIGASAHDTDSPVNEICSGHVIL